MHDMIAGHMWATGEIISLSMSAFLLQYGIIIGDRTCTVTGDHRDRDVTLYPGGMASGDAP
jgi:hypothetical protein